MSPKPASTTPSDADKTREQLLAELGELRSQNAVLKESRAKSTNIQNRPGNRVEEELRRANRALKALSECKEAMIRAGDEAVLLNDICQIIVNVGGYRMAWIGYIENDEVKTVRPVARAGYDEGYVDNLKIALEDPVRGNGPTGICLKTGKPYGSRNVQSDEEMLPWRAEALKRGYHSTLNLPIVYEKQVIGALVIYSGEVDVFDEEERGLLFGLAQTLAYGITAMRDRARRILAEEELKRANEELEMRVEERTEKLRESEERFRATFEQSAVGMTQVSLDGRFLRVNKKFCDITGYTEDELLGLTVMDITYPPDVAVEKEKIKKLLAGEANTFYSEKRYMKKDGSLIWVKLTVALVYNHGKPGYMTGVTEDITERKRAEEKISHLASFPSLNPNPIVETDLDGNPSYMNPSARTIFPDLNEKGPAHPILAGLKAVVNELEAKKKSYIVREVTVDGSYFQETIHSVPDKKALRIYVLDITKSKRAEEELREAKKQAELYVDLMGHDIRNMNQVGMGFLELALDSPSIGKKDKELLLKSMDALESSTRLIENVGKVQKAQSWELKHSEVDACQAILRVLAHYSNMPGIKATFNYELPPGCPVIANELLYEVFENIVGNAIKHTGPEPIIGIKFETASLDGKNYNKFIIEDTGPGIPDDMKDRLFNRLHRGDTKAKGSGLGLYLVKSLVDGYGGRVWVEDRIMGDHTKGARFVVMLPVVEN